MHLPASEGARVAEPPQQLRRHRRDHVRQHDQRSNGWCVDDHLRSVRADAVDGHRGDLLGLRRSGDPRRLHALLLPSVVHPDVGDEAGTDDREADRGPLVFGAQCVGEADEAVLARAVRRAVGDADLARTRCDVDHVTAAALQHARHDGVGQQDRCFEVDRQRLGEVGLGSILEASDPFDAGVVDQDVDRAQLGLGPRQQPRSVVGARDIAHGRDRPDAESLHLEANLFQFGLGPGGERQVDTLVRQRTGDVHTDATRCAGDDGVGPP
jgi:hypothetical protein